MKIRKHGAFLAVSLIGVLALVSCIRIPPVQEPQTLLAPSQAGVTVQVSSQGTISDGSGKTLYRYAADGVETHGRVVSRCYDSCAQEWPPVLTKGRPVAGAGAQASLVGVTARGDGTAQATYNGWPLYYSSKDAKAGDANGVDTNDQWATLGANGHAPGVFDRLSKPVFR